MIKHTIMKHTMIIMIRIEQESISTHNYHEHDNNADDDNII